MNSNRLYSTHSHACRLSKSTFGLLCIGLMTAFGCQNSVDGPPRAAVSGTVTVDGEPLETGTIRFVPAMQTGGPKVSAVVNNGWFDLPREFGPVVGQHRIEIEAPPAGDIEMDDEQALERLRQAGRKARIEVVRIPAVYNTKSQLAAEISATEPNDLSFDLLSKTGR